MNQKDTVGRLAVLLDSATSPNSRLLAFHPRRPRGPRMPLVVTALHINNRLGSRSCSSVHRLTMEDQSQNQTVAAVGRFAVGEEESQKALTEQYKAHKLW